jgi:hypothetical protein
MRTAFFASGRRRVRGLTPFAVPSGARRAAFRDEFVYRNSFFAIDLCDYHLAFSVSESG